MSVNKYKQHVLILPEDDANRQIANGFLLDVNTRRVKVQDVAGGWSAVLDVFSKNHADAMRRNERRYMILLIDFDGRVDRLDAVRRGIPDGLTDRVFILGALTEPEALRQAGLGTYEGIGRELADDCRCGAQGIWAHDLLRHNEGELGRLRASACGLFFDA
jgi:hypothetical protein